MEEMYKSAEWYEKKSQTQLQHLTEKHVEQTGNELREKAGELSGIFATELNQASRAYIGQTQQQLDEAVRDAFERVRLLFAEAADTTSAAFTDEIQRNARQELEGFNELMNKSVELSRERLDATRAEISQRVTAEQEEYLRRFQAGMSGAVEMGLQEAQEQVKSSFASLLNSWKSVTEEKDAELRAAFGKISDESAVGYRDRLENISNSWMVATVATLDHQSRDVVAKIATAAEERLREATAEVFARFADTLRERLQQMAIGFDLGKNPPKS
jgi:vacuolar-type H+-ATPase subunit D/Vma8